MIVVILKKYELLEDDQIVVSGHTLYRIRALRDFGNVEAGDLGGYIEKESNLSHEGICWVYDNARVFENARVYDDAWVSCYACVYDKAQVFGDALVFDGAHVSGGAWVFDNARVYGNAWVDDNAQVYGGACVGGEARVVGGANLSTISDIVWFSNVDSEYGTLTVYKEKGGNLIAKMGCFVGTVDEFLEQSARVDSEKTHREFQLLIEVAKSRMLG